MKTLLIAITLAAALCLFSRAPGDDLRHGTVPIAVGPIYGDATRDGFFCKDETRYYGFFAAVYQNGCGVNLSYPIGSILNTAAAFIIVYSLKFIIVRSWKGWK